LVPLVLRLVHELVHGIKRAARRLVSRANGRAWPCSGCVAAFTGQRGRLGTHA
jgi:hypothetical protein